MAILYKMEPKTDEEILAVNDLLLEMRKEKLKQENIVKYKHEISFLVGDAISTIGLDETKRIVREINKELREL